jgi:hypothetical protein
MLSYSDMQFMMARQLGPEHGPQEYPDIAPFPLWLVPPAWRCARRDDILAAIARFREEQQAGGELGEVTTQALARWFERLDVAWNRAEGLQEWRVREPAALLLVWKYGVKASMRSPFVEEQSPFPHLTAWFRGTLEPRWTAERETWQAGGARTPFEAGERAAVVLCIKLSSQYERLEKLVGQLAQVYGEAPAGTDTCLDFYDALQRALDERTLPPYREVVQGLCGSLSLMEAEIEYRAQLDEQVE